MQICTVNSEVFCTNGVAESPTVAILYMLHFYLLVFYLYFLLICLYFWPAAHRDPCSNNSASATADSRKPGRMWRLCCKCKETNLYFVFVFWFCFNKWAWAQVLHLQCQVLPLISSAQLRSSITLKLHSRELDICTCTPEGEGLSSSWIDCGQTYPVCTTGHNSTDLMCAATCNLITRKFTSFSISDGVPVCRGASLSHFLHIHTYISTAGYKHMSLESWKSQICIFTFWLACMCNCAHQHMSWVSQIHIVTHSAVLLAHVSVLWALKYMDHLSSLATCIMSNCA